MEGVNCVLLDIEGTVCPISFVKDTLFPYAIKALPQVLADEWDSPEFEQYRNAFPEEYRNDPQALQAHVADLTKRDVKVAYLKNLQGYLWATGYKTGAYATDLFPDVVPALKHWKDSGYALAIYSSGSVFAQKLLFGHVQRAADDWSGPNKRSRDESEDGAKARALPPSKSETTTSSPTFDKAAERLAGSRTADMHDEVLAGNFATEDLRGLVEAWFDTTNAGSKTESDSYSKIAEALNYSPGHVLFLSDNVKEVDAAIAAGMKSRLVDRPGNAPVSDATKERLDMIDSLDKIHLPNKATEVSGK